MNRPRFTAVTRRSWQAQAILAILFSVLMPWQPLATGMSLGGSAATGLFGLGQVLTSDGWSLDLALALEPFPFDAPGGAPTVRSGPWRLHARPDPGGVTIVQERALVSRPAIETASRWFSIRARFAPLVGNARPFAPAWLGEGTDDRVMLALDAGARVLTAVGWRHEAPADWWSSVSARAAAAGADLRRLEPGFAEGRQPSDWIAVGGYRGQHVILTAHPYRGGTGWVLQSVEARS